jgi:hypothetical protein
VRKGSASRTPPRELRFVAAPPAGLAPGEVALDARSDLAPLQRSQGTAWRDAFVAWLGALNRSRASLAWWSYSSTAKNLLSSPLGDRCLQLLALDRFLAQTQAHTVFVSGATPAQQEAMRLRLKQSPWRVAGAGGIPRLAPLARSLWQFARILGLWGARRLRAPAGAAPQALLFTYVDAGFRDAPDAFFGPLAGHLPVSSCHVAFVQCAYRDALPKLAAARGARYEPLFGSLRLVDLLWALGASLAAWWRAARYDAPPLGGIPATPLLREALRWDVGQGGYFYNLLVYRAARRLHAAWRPAWLIYPFENKALEKLLLLAARAASPRTRIVGYQHTSITRRHATLLFAEGEAAATPMPDRVVTVGDVTRRYLEREGRYPPGLFVTGCALRQQGGAPLERRVADGKPRLLLALSSSRRELVEAVDACRRARAADPALELAIRTHPEFPLALLPAELRAWADANAINLAGSALAANLEWCDAVVYVSSTVALEALGRGRPVINLAISDPLDPDPVLDPLAFHWSADSPAALAAAAREIVSLAPARFEQARREALEYVAEYLRPPTPAALEAFLPA